MPAKSMHDPWTLQDAKSRLSDLIDLVQSGESQIILRRGAPAAAVVSMADYETLRRRRSLASFLLHSPLLHSGLDLAHAEERFEPRLDVIEQQRS